jgi:hypothetical protein
MFAFVIWLFIDRSILPLTSVDLFAMAVGLTVLAAQVDWVFGVRKLMSPLHRSARLSRMRSPEIWSWNGEALPPGGPVEEEYGSEIELLRGKMSNAGVLCYSVFASGFALVSIVIIISAVYIPASFLVVLAALFLDMLLTLLVFGTRWLDTLSCASVSKRGLCLCRNMFSRERQYAIRDVIIHAEDLAFGLVRMTVDTGDSTYVLVSDASVFRVLHMMREAEVDDA